mmetsp:Transcript_55531/g.108738  ORF Transcript_55531/g.108738 Transcript_55531/m.108738 type:complete len:100 (+) Transcript_55531:145-444(+)
MKSLLAFVCSVFMTASAQDLLQGAPEADSIADLTSPPSVAVSGSSLPSRSETGTIEAQQQGSFARDVGRNFRDAVRDTARGRVDDRVAAGRDRRDERRG